jgi:hypothetical protein
MRKFLSLSLVFVLVVSSSLAQDNAAAVVKKAIEAHGGTDALTKAKTAKSTSKGVITMAGNKVDYTANATYSLPDLYKLEVTGEIAKLKLISTQVLNNKKVKARSTLAGAEQPLDAKVKDETIQAALVQEASLLTPLVEGKKYTIKSDKDAEVNGSPASVVIASGNGLKDLKLFFDQKTNLLVKMQRCGRRRGRDVPVGIQEVRRSPAADEGRRESRQERVHDVDVERVQVARQS